jgi:hypothetical protein
MKEDGVRLPRIRSPQQDDVRLFDLLIRTCSAARSEDCRQTGDAGRVSSPVAAVDVVRPHDGADELLGRVIQLIRGLGAAEHAEAPRIVFLNRPVESLRHSFQSFIPRGWPMPAVFADERLL